MVLFLQTQKKLKIKKLKTPSNLLLLQTEFLFAFPLPHITQTSQIHCHYFRFGLHTSESLQSVQLQCHSTLLLKRYWKYVRVLRQDRSLNSVSNVLSDKHWTQCYFFHWLCTLWQLIFHQFWPQKIAELAEKYIPSSVNLLWNCKERSEEIYPPPTPYPTQEDSKCL